VKTACLTLSNTQLINQVLRFKDAYPWMVILLRYHVPVQLDSTRQLHDISVGPTTQRTDTPVFSGGSFSFKPFAQSCLYSVIRFFSIS
jgi:hypothetical protein